ncbi:MAG: ABC transporter substrate-binding protein [Clostridia bacterium]
MKKRIWALLIAASMLATLSLTGCSAETEEESSTASVESSEDSSVESEEETTLTDEVIKIYGVIDPQLSAQQIIAEKMGYYEDLGLNIENVYITSGGDMSSYIASGEAQVSFETSYTTTPLTASDVEITMLATVNNIGATQAVVASADSGIVVPSDMEGKTIGMASGSGVYIAIQECCEAYGVDFDTIEFVTLTSADQLAALENGSIDMMACWEPYVTTAQEDFGGTLIFTGTHSYFEGYDEDVSWLNFYTTFQVTDEFLAEYPAECEALLVAYSQATDYINENMEDAAAIIAEELSLESDDVYAIMLKNVYDMEWSDDFKEATDVIAQNQYDNGNIEFVPEFDTYADPTSLINACPELFTATNIE